ncbi:integrase [Streptomyces sp. SID10815]|uniref:integrase n=1 Tax=Streptomyces sp. SID10815 TaxID=2706027 RepID=UPI0013C560BB|nr:integrase [Streptomyces sp. SID10815]NEA52338.1 integrase [Streptomyces sp. SID10815]
MPWVEVRGGNIRVKWWAGEYKTDADGKPTKKKSYESASGPEPGVPFQDEGEAYNYGLDREHDVRHGKHIPRASAKTLMETYCWLWFERAELRPNSQRTYRSMLRAVIVPYWGARPVGDISALEYDLWKKQVRASYSDNYASQLLGLFRMLMTDSILKYKLRTETPIIEQPRRGRYEKKQTRRVKRIMPIEVVHQLATNAYQVWGFTGWTYIWTIAFTAMRPPGEMYGLQRGYASPTWPASEPDRERREEAEERYKDMHVLRVQYQLYYVDSKPTLAAPKYDSHRSLVVPSFLHDMHVALLASHCKPWVFTSKTGKALLGTQFARDYWHPIRDGRKETRPEKKQYERFIRPAVPAVEAMAGQDLYRLRHWHRELLDEPGADIARVAKEARMGHELPGVEGVYSMVTQAMEERIVEYLEGVWEKLMARGVWTPPLPTRLPDGELGDAAPLFSGLPKV